MLLYQVAHYPHVWRGVGIKSLIASTKYLIRLTIPGMRAKDLPGTLLIPPVWLVAFVPAPFLHRDIKKLD